MRINRAIGLLIFLAVAHVVIGEMFGAFSKAVVALMNALETASNTAAAGIQIN